MPLLQRRGHSVRTGIAGSDRDGNHHRRDSRIAISDHLALAPSPLSPFPSLTQGLICQLGDPTCKAFSAGVFRKRAAVWTNCSLPIHPNDSEIGKTPAC
jgi:hypothetical protein